MSTAEALLQKLRQRGVLLAVAGGRLRFRARPGCLEDGLRDAVGACRSELSALVAAEWCPADRPRPNLHDLARDHGVGRVRAVFEEFGCDPAPQDLTWEVIATAAELLGPPPTKAVRPPIACEPLTPAFERKTQRGWSDERFSALCRRVLGRPGPASAEDDARIATAMGGTDAA